MIKSNQGEIVLNGSYKVLISELGSIIISLKEMINANEDADLVLDILETDILFAFMAKDHDDYMELTKFDSKNKMRLLKKVAQVLEKGVTTMDKIEEIEEFEEDIEGWQYGRMVRKGGGIDDKEKN